MSINILPNELLILISINYLNINEIRRLINVCKLYYQLFTSDSVWYHIFLKLYSKCDNNNNKLLPSSSTSSSPNNNSNNNNSNSCIHINIDDNICLICGQMIQLIRNTIPTETQIVPHTVVSSPQQLAQLLAIERQRITLMELNREGIEYDSSIFSTPNSTTNNTLDITKSPTINTIKQTITTTTTTTTTIPGKLEWKYHFAIPSTFLFIFQSNDNQNRNQKIIHNGQILSHLEVDYHNLSNGMWYFRCKQIHSEVFCCKSWKSLSESWKWIRSVLRDRLYLIWKTYPVMIPSMSSDSSGQSNSNIISSNIITRAAAKLTSVNWIRFYETIKEEMTIQADGIAQDIVSKYYCKVNSQNSNIQSDNNHLNINYDWKSSFSISKCLSLLEYIIKYCKVYSSWSDELDNLLLALNSRITNDRDSEQCKSTTQRYKRTRDGICIDKDNENSSQFTLYIEDLSCLLLRSHCLLQWQVCEMLRFVIETLSNFIEEIDLIQLKTELPINDPLLKSQYNQSFNYLIQFYELIKSLDVPDESLCSHFRFDHEMNAHISNPTPTRQIFKEQFHDLLRSQHSLLPYIRQADKMFLQNLETSNINYK